MIDPERLKFELILQIELFQKHVKIYGPSAKELLNVKEQNLAPNLIKHALRNQDIDSETYQKYAKVLS